MNAGVHSWTLRLIISLLALACLAPCGSLACGTRVQLTDGTTGREIISEVLSDGDAVTLTWKNSLFGLQVTEVYVARSGILVQTAVSFSLPGGGEPPVVRPEDVDDLYHTGGPFKAEGLSRPIEKVSFLVGEIGNPALRVGDRIVEFVREVGFGGTVVLEVRRAGLPGRTERR